MRSTNGASLVSDNTDIENRRGAIIRSSERHGRSALSLQRGET